MGTLVARQWHAGGMERYGHACGTLVELSPHACGIRVAREWHACGTHPNANANANAGHPHHMDSHTHMA